MAYGIGRNIALMKWEINEADFLWNWNYFSSLIQIYELCFQHKIGTQQDFVLQMIIEFNDDYE